MKQTAVEWLIEEYINGAVINIQIMKKALEIEKEQMKNMWRGGQWSVELGGEFDEYYNETFNKK